eukprot:208675-Amphidinium_carterae.2
MQDSVLHTQKHSYGDWVSQKRNSHTRHVLCLGLAMHGQRIQGVAQILHCCALPDKYNNAKLMQINQLK